MVTAIGLAPNSTAQVADSWVFSINADPRYMMEFISTYIYIYTYIHSHIGWKRHV